MVIPGQQDGKRSTIEDLASLPPAMMVVLNRQTAIAAFQDLQNQRMARSFFSLIERMEELPAMDRAALEEEVWREFGVTMAIMALDMSQFSISVRRSSIVANLQLVRRMRLLTAPIVAAAGVEVVKCEADNMMAVFQDVPQAVAAAIAIAREFARDGRISAGIGIDCGQFLRIPEHDCFGDPVNIAFILGEDIALAREILLSPAARERLGDDTLTPLTELLEPFAQHRRGGRTGETRKRSRVCNAK